MKAQTFTVKADKIIESKDKHYRHVHLNLPENADFKFQSGQYVILLLLTPDGKEIPVYYSIASAPQETHAIELFWKRPAKPEMAELLWNIQVGDSLKLECPGGKFILRKPLPKRIIFISTGTGIAPFRSMIYDLLAQNYAGKIWNICGNRYVRNVFYYHEFKNLELKHPHFKNIFTISASDEKSWEGATEYVQHQLEKHIRPDTDTHIYVCGRPEMVDEVNKTALKMGFSEKQIIFEKY